MQNRSAIQALGHNFRTKNISHRAQKIVISPIKEMSILADKFRQETGNDIISFGQGIPYLDTPEYIKDAIRQSLSNPDTAKYTLEPGVNELRELVAKHLQKNKGAGKADSQSEVMISVGCQEAVDCALASLIDEGDEVLIFSPGFASHIEQTILFGGVPVFVPLDEENGWAFNAMELEKRITPKSKVILFSNPSNPTGAVLQETEIREIYRIAQENDLVIIADETYDFLVYEGEHFSPVSILGAKERTVLCSSFSKKFAMTGYRVGFAYSDSGIIDHMLKTHDALAICAPAISQMAAIASFDREDTVFDFQNQFFQNRGLMCDELSKMSDIFSFVKPKGAYYILAKYSIPLDSFDLALKILREANVITIPGAAFGPEGEGHLRFSFAGNPEKIKEGFQRLEKWSKTL